MPIFKKHFKNHLGQFHGMNTALAVLTSLYVIGAAVALTSPYWASSYPVLAPLVAFAATPLGMGILATVTVALIGLAVYAISKNNKISEGKAPKLIVHNNQVMLQVTRDVFKEMKKNNQVENEEGKHYIDFSLDSKDYRVIIGDESTQELGNALLFAIDSLKVKGGEGKYALVTDENKELEALGLEEQGDEINTYLDKLSPVQPAGQGKGK